MDVSDEARRSLRADCSSCFGLCCVATAFSASAAFAIDKPAGTPCPNLRDDFACSVHDRLRLLGFAGCTVYDCFGAGQRVAQETYDVHDWRTRPATREEMFGTFEVMRILHELLWYLSDAAGRPQAVGLVDELHRAHDEVARLTHEPPTVLVSLDVDGLRGDLGGLLRRASTLVRDGAGERSELAGADLAGRRLQDLRGADLRAAVLIGADLRGADLDRADVIGADLRGCDVSGADLSSTLYLTQFQVNAARGDEETRLPPVIDRPTHWGPTGRS